MTRPALLLIPGLLCTEQLWAPQVAALADLADIHVGDHARDLTIAAIAERILAELSLIHI